MYYSSVISYPFEFWIAHTQISFTSFALLIEKLSFCFLILLVQFRALVTSPRTYLIWLSAHLIFYLVLYDACFTLQMTYIIHEFLSGMSWREVSFSCDYLSINTSIDWTCVIGCENGLWIVMALKDGSVLYQIKIASTGKN